MYNNLYKNRHIGISGQEQIKMLKSLGYTNLNDFIHSVIPQDILSTTHTPNLSELDEHSALEKLKQFAKQNKLYKNYIGMGYYDTITPSVIKRNVFENPGWYTAYTPYQAEISQGRLEALLNFQQMIMDLTGFDLANASLLDEATAAAESMSMAKRMSKSTSNKFFVTEGTFPHTIDVIKTRAKYQSIEIVTGNLEQFVAADHFGIFIQNPDFYGTIKDYTNTIEHIKVQNSECIVAMACDILSLVLFKAPAAMGADIAIGSTQRFGVPIGFGGPSAAYMATREANKRIMPGRIIGIAQDSNGKKALRMSLQTREQHIRREKATSNICTAQALLANMAGFYAIYHGKNGLKEIAQRIHKLSILLAHNLRQAGLRLKTNHNLFDTISWQSENHQEIYTKLANAGYAIGIQPNSHTLFISLGEASNINDVVEIFNLITNSSMQLEEFIGSVDLNNELYALYNELFRQDDILVHEVFNSYHSETKMMRYLKKLENKDISLVHSMIPLGSCTMKLNAAATLEGLSWPEFANIHPFAPQDASIGYINLINDLKLRLMEITGFSDVSMQPNSGAQGEFAGLVAITRYQKSIGQGHRNICLIPRSAHGTNPATAQMVGLSVVVINCDSSGNVDIKDLTTKAGQYKDSLSCLMITYPSTHGVFEAQIKQICSIIHINGGQVYMDGANLNAMVGLVKPAELGADVSHINLHKTFAIPHGGGGPGMGPIGVADHLAKFLPKHSMLNLNKNTANIPNAPQQQTNTLNIEEHHAVSSSPFGSASILLISWMYITMLGTEGLKQSTQTAILNANYIANCLKPYYKILYTGNNDLVAHECIIDLRPIKEETGISEVDFAKRLMDYGFHAPTMSFPVAGTLMIEPTESEDKQELDRFINAMISIYNEVLEVKNGKQDKVNNVLKNAPHTLADISNWDKPYSVDYACFPSNYLKDSKIFASVNRIDDAYGDRNFFCSCFDFKQLEDIQQQSLINEVG